MVFLTVAPHVGAWIETEKRCLTQDSALSHPMWVRGLKLGTRCQGDYPTESHPMWVRGLKRDVGVGIGSALGSHPMWVRGLKLLRNHQINLRQGRTPCGCVD